jgi:hypothetical protein
MLQGAFDATNAEHVQALSALLALQPLTVITNVLSLLGPAVQFALTILQDPASRTSANVEEFATTLILAIAQTLNRLDDAIVIPLDDDMLQGITVTVRNIIDVYQKDYGDIDVPREVSFFLRLFTRYGGACCCCKKTVKDD